MWSPLSFELSWFNKICFVFELNDVLVSYNINFLMVEKEGICK